MRYCTYVPSALARLLPSTVTETSWKHTASLTSRVPYTWEAARLLVTSEQDFYCLMTAPLVPEDRQGSG